MIPRTNIYIPEAAPRRESSRVMRCVVDRDIYDIQRGISVTGEVGGGGALHNGTLLLESYSVVALHRL